MNTFGKNLERLMKEHKISGRALAKKLQVPPKTLNEWLGAGARMPRNSEVLKELSSIFQVSVHELLFGEPDPLNLIGSLIDKTEIHSGTYEISIKKITARK